LGWVKATAHFADVGHNWQSGGLRQIARRCANRSQQKTFADMGLNPGEVGSKKPRIRPLPPAGEAARMNAFLLEYLPIVVFLGIAIVLGAGFMLAAWVLAPKNPDTEKLSAYECGFNAFDDARMKFDVR